MKVLSTEYITIYEIYHNETLYIRQVKTSIEDIIQPPLWFVSENDAISIIIQESIIIELEQKFLSVIE